MNKKILVKGAWYAIMLGALLAFYLMFIGCATHYVPSQCALMEKPPIFSNPNWVKIIIVDPQTNKLITYYALPASEAYKEGLNVDVAKEYIGRAYELNRNE